MKRPFKARPFMESALIWLLLYVLLCALMCVGVTPEQVNIKVGLPSPTQIKASKDIVDTVTTDALREAAANAVEPSYKSVDYTVSGTVTANIRAVFDILSGYLGKGVSDPVLSSLNSDISTALSSDLSEDEEAPTLSISRAQAEALLSLKESDLEALRDEVVRLVENTLNATLPEGQETNAVRSISTELKAKFPENVTSAASGIITALIRPNMLIDEEITEANRQKARESVAEEGVVKDEVIVREGEIVTLAQYTMIASMGILENNQLDVPLIVGIALLVMLMIASLIFYMIQYRKKIMADPKQQLLFAVILFITVACSFAFRVVNSYFMPASLGLLLIIALFDARPALFANIMLAVMVSLLASSGNTSSSAMYAITVMTLLSAPAVTFLYGKHSQRTTALIAGIIIAAVNFCVTLCFGLFASAETDTTLNNAMWAAGGGLASAVLAIGILPVLEGLFNQATATKLIELANPERPLLRRLQMEAPGTYHHCILVANLAEAGACAIGANGLLARVGAYYHDIGKLKRPQYFKENQLGENPHDHADPRVSVAILTAHPRDGMLMGQKAHLPQPVLDIIQQHHGDSTVKFFYNKACEQAGELIDSTPFRYEGPRPQSQEAAIVMLADTVEAATRSLKAPTPEKVDEMIRKLVREKMNDGQLALSNLTFNQLDAICRAFSNALTGVYHERIEYPELNLPQKKAESAEPAKPVPKPAEMPSVPPTPEEPKAEQTPAEEKHIVVPNCGIPVPPVLDADRMEDTHNVH